LADHSTARACQKPNEGLSAAGSAKARRPDDPDRNNPGSHDDFDVIGTDRKIVGRISRPGGGAVDWM